MVQQVVSHIRIGLLVWGLVTGLFTTGVQAQVSTHEFIGLGLEELMDMKVTSVSKSTQSLSETAAAVYVITSEDIRRSGATSIPEVLRQVPGLHVAQIDANKWAITARGFNSRFANKLLVMIDGRSVYSPTYSGTYWDVQDTLLEDIDRIEVIRGPGASVWGANAVNGVINILTKEAQDTQGALFTAGGGSHEHGFGSLRYGGQLTDTAFYRVYVKYFNRDHFADTLGNRTHDDWDMLRGGFRLDWQVAARDRLTVQGDIYDGQAGQTVPLSLLRPPFEQIVDHAASVAGGNILARWQHIATPHSDMTLQLYYDRTTRDDVLVHEDRDSVDLDFQHRFAFGKRHAIIWGLGYRFTRDDFDNTPTAMLSPDSRSQHLWSGFVQDEISLIEDRLSLTLGVKLEHNAYTGFEYQPSVRLAWTPHKRHTVWGAISRAVRTPSRVENDFRLNFTAFPGPDGFLNTFSIFGTRDFESEELLSYELGYRVQPLDRLFFDISAFYMDYDNLWSVSPGTPFFEGQPSPPHLVIPQRFGNAGEAATYGLEVATQWTMTKDWRIAAGYTWFENHYHRTGDPEGNDPRYQFNVRSYLNLPWDFEFDTLVYFVDALPEQDIGSYTRLDVRLGWQWTDSLELSVVGQNLLDRRHTEFGDPFSERTGTTQIERGLYGKITWRF